EEQLNFTETENGAVALRSTLDPVLDAFGSLGAMRYSEDEYIIRVFSKAYAANRELAMRLLFYIRDIRGGQGERKTFRVLARWLAENHTQDIVDNLDNFLNYGRGDDLFCLIDTKANDQVFKYINDKIASDMDFAMNGKGSECSLLAKWMPSENASSKETRALAKRMAKELGLSPRAYRKTLTKLRTHIGVVEQKMSANRFPEIEYEKVPSRAHMIYANAFMRHDEPGYAKYIKDVAAGNVKINAGALFPVDIVHRMMSVYRASDVDKAIANVQWESLPNYLDGVSERGICVVDVSGSMSGTPMEVAISLGLYNADKCNGPFHGKFITFSSHPEIQSVVGETIYEKIRNMSMAHWDMNTNIELVFREILKTAINSGCSQEDMPSKVYIISDMQFDHATRFGEGGALMDGIRADFESNGYRLPSIVYWNVRQSECGMFQSTYRGVDCCMVSGYSPSLFEAVARGTEYVQEENGNVREVLDPIQVMLSTLMSDRYDAVVIRN
ncbi:MAG: DUF2828 family protein, partial [Clostridia bacterium]|nr:DUF2828 family protein [Clostridia bacterium]